MKDLPQNPNGALEPVAAEMGQARIKFMHDRGWAVFDAIAISLLTIAGKMVWERVETLLETLLFFTLVALLSYLILGFVYRQMAKRVARIAVIASQSSDPLRAAETFQLKQKIEVLEERLRFADSTEKMRVREIDEWAKKYSEAETVMNAIGPRNVELVEQNLVLMNSLRYGESSERMAELPDDDLRAVRENIAELMPAIEAAHGRAMRIIRALLIPMSEAPDDSDQRWLSAFLFVPVEQAARAHDLLVESIAAKGDPRSPLIIWYGRYNWMRVWMGRLYHLRRVWPIARDDYVAWLKRDEEFFSQFGRKMRVERLEAVAAAVRRFRENNDYPSGLPSIESSS